MSIALYSTRLVLNALGAEDYGIFSLVSGVIVMLSFLNVAMTISTQRYLSYFIGAGDQEKLKQVFNSSVLLHFLMGITLVIIFEVVGMFFFNQVLNIPAVRLNTAKIIFHFTVISTFFTIASVPYDATLTARENMLLIAGIGIWESLAKLGIAIYLQYTAYDKLVVYGGLIASVTIISLLIKRVYCSAKHQEAHIRIRRYFSKSLLKEMFSYAGWNMFGAGSVVARNQGLAMILNVFFGAVINATYGIANQVNSQLSYFSVTMLQSLNPQIIKSEGSGDRPRMLRLAMIASKFSFFLLSFFAIPVIIEMPELLKLWLKNVPAHSIIFCRLIIIVSMITQLTVGLQVAIQSVGRIKTYQIVVSALLMLNLPVSYVLLKTGLPPHAVLVSAICIEAVTCSYRVLAAHRLTGLSVSEYLRKGVLTSLVPVAVAFCIALLPQLVMAQGFLRLLVTCCVGGASVLLCVKFLGLTAYEQEKIEGIIMKGLSKVQLRFSMAKAN
ncbi:MAG TPA: hypothetical protein VFS25_15400 [Chitinophaga sp.]|nr:hypothetical protein [Chitinophaga sp.]